jgi:hypothetical protein
MTKVTFVLTKAQSLIVAPLFDELRAMNDAAFAEGKEMAGAAVTGQVFWGLGQKTPTAEIVLLDPKTALQMQKLLKRRKRERKLEEADLASKEHI